MKSESGVWMNVEDDAVPSLVLVPGSRREHQARYALTLWRQIGSLDNQLIINFIVS